MRNLLGSGSGHLADTPPNGDFARYVEELVARQAKALAGGQHITPVPRQPAAPIPPQSTRAQTRAAELRKPPVAAQTDKTTARTVSLDSWDDIQQALKKDASPPMPGGGFKIPPFFLFMAVIVLIGAASYFGLDATWPVFILFWLFVLSRMVRTVLGAFRGSKPGQPPQRK
ncbi:formate dehydrogenase accessory protein FdhE [Diaphorobacter sp. HDW4A]|uniref:formate dehydrogenase accessory protein FdhE n=1 Tax=Diaphorobacter sp. HDW4A TaxID=2714924 RepID=UPI00140D6AD2|nr:formate dehydrogenase accessory protein FdhE [Diaphorobacter sp. HDW4A]QIL81279.1 formate dehydrogenase accessory protein FdhE [Diaphorobacter sp. HDW4A]